MAKSTSSMHGDLPYFKSGGSYYDFGYSVGAHFRERIHSFFKESETSQKTMIAFCQTREGRNFFEDNLRVTEACFPQYIRECRGIADGAELPFEHVFMANVWEVNTIPILKQQAAEEQEERSAAAGSPETGCSTLFINSEDTRLILHTEDQPPLVKRYGYLVSADISEDGHKEQFTAFCCPGCVPGLAFNISHQGLVFTSNELRPATIARGAISRAFLTRALLTAKSIESAVQIAVNAPYGSAYGFTANLSTRDGDMACVEVAPGHPKASVHVQHVSRSSVRGSDCHYYHFNQYKHLTVPEIGELMTSKRRAQRVCELPPPQALKDALTVAADTKDEEYPIFRTPRPTDMSITAYTVVFDILHNEMKIYGERQHLLDNTPILTLPLWTGQVA